MLDKAGLVVDNGGSKLLPKRKVDQRELKGLSAYMDFIDTLNLGHFDKGKASD